jgi:hypothetical protein
VPLNLGCHGSLLLAQKPDRLLAREAYFENRTLSQDWLEADFDLNWDPRLLHLDRQQEAENERAGDEN